MVAKGLLFLGLSFVFVNVLMTSCQRLPGCPPDKECVRYMAWGNPEQLEVERQMIADFNRKNPDLYVKLFTVPANSYHQKMVMMLASGTAPDAG